MVFNSFQAFSWLYNCYFSYKSIFDIFVRNLKEIIKFKTFSFQIKRKLVFPEHRFDEPMALVSKLSRKLIFLTPENFKFGNGNSCKIHFSIYIWANKIYYIWSDYHNYCNYFYHEITHHNIFLLLWCCVAFRLVFSLSKRILKAVIFKWTSIKNRCNKIANSPILAMCVYKNNKIWTRYSCIIKLKIMK